MKNIERIIPPNFGWLELELEKNEIDYLWRCIKNKKEDAKKNLAGNITGSYQLPDKSNWFFLNVLKPLCIEYKEQFRNLAAKLPINQIHPFFLQSFWVNFQNQHEFNPMHSHGGVYSFVIWLKIPTSYFEQKKNPIALNSNNNSVSNFEFMYPNILGLLEPFTYEMSPKLEGTMLFFPSQLRHAVYPYYNCDEERISISGNISLNTAKKL